MILFRPISIYLILIIKLKTFFFLYKLLFLVDS